MLHPFRRFALGHPKVKPPPVEMTLDPQDFPNYEWYAKAETEVMYRHAKRLAAHKLQVITFWRIWCFLTLAWIVFAFWFLASETSIKIVYLLAASITVFTLWLNEMIRKMWLEIDAENEKWRSAMFDQIEEVSRMLEEGKSDESA